MTTSAANTSSMPDTIRRRAPGDAKPSVPQPLPFAEALALVDTSWGRIQPIRLADGVETVGELEVLAHLRAGLPLIDTRGPASFAASTIPGSRSLPYDRVDAWRDQLETGIPYVMFCNGPQCPATPKVVQALLDAGHPATTLRYYRGGMHDWVTLGLPVVAAAADATAV